MDTPTLPEVIAGALDAWQSRIRTAIPARVLYYNRTVQTAQVRPEVWPGGAASPVVDNVPVLWPRGGDGYLVFPLAADDTGLLLCCDSAIGEWRRTGEAGAPADLARHSLQGACFVPGLVPRGEDLDAVAGATILAGGDVRLGAYTATHPLLFGDSFRTAMATWIEAVRIAVTAGGGGDLTASNATLLAAIDAALSALVVTA